MSNLCNFFWGSHGCELPEGEHTVHQCSWVITDMEDEQHVELCSEYDEKADFNNRVRHNSNRYSEPVEWSNWGPYGEGWRQ